MATSKAQRENTFAYIVAAALVVIIALAGVWWKFFHIDGPDTSIEFTKFGPYQIETQDYSLAATLSVKTTQSSGEWPKRNRAKLNVIFENILSAIDVKAIKSADGLANLQEKLKTVANDQMKVDDIQAVVFTDWLMQVHEHD